LSQEIKEKKFREDLFYRLNVVPIRVPALRERREDIPLLADYFLKKYAAQWKKPIEVIDSSALELLSHYSWPGNIRELENVVNRTVVFCEGTQILKVHLPPEVFHAGDEDQRERGPALDYHSFKLEKMNLLEWEFFRTLLSRYQGDVCRIA